MYEYVYVLFTILKTCNIIFLKTKILKMIIIPLNVCQHFPQDTDKVSGEAVQRKYLARLINHFVSQLYQYFAEKYKVY